MPLNYKKQGIGTLCQTLAPDIAVVDGKGELINILIETVNRERERE